MSDQTAAPTDAATTTPASATTAATTPPVAPSFQVDYANPLIAHAVIELQKAGVDDATTANYLLAIQGFVNLQLDANAIQQITVLLNNENLTAITNDPSEWTELSPTLWSNTRNDKVFSQDGGKTYNYLSVADRVTSTTYAAPATTTDPTTATS